MSGGRRTFGPVVLLGLVAGALTAVGGNKAWVELEGADAATSTAVSFVTSGSVPAAGALGLVVLACWGVLLVTRGRVRRVVAVLGLLAAVGAVVAAVLGWPAALDQVRAALEQSGVESGVRSTAWAWAGTAGALLSVVATALAVLLVPAWPEMGRRYDAPGATTPPAGATPATAGTDGADDVGDRANLDMWRALDEGHDPTA